VTILHVDTDPGWRGGQQLLLRLACGLVADGVPTQVACPRGGRLHRELVARKIDVLGIPAGASLRTIPQLRRAAPRLLVAHTSHAHGLCAMSGLPVVVHRWVDAPLSATPWSRWKYARPVRFVACSHAVKGVLEAGGVESDRICVVHGGTEPLDGQAAADAPEVLAVGALVHHKGHDVLAEAVRRLRGQGRSLDVGVAGEGPLRPPGLRLLGQRDDIGALLAGARIFVHPSRSEGLGMAVVEAMMAGLPVVASRVGGIPEIVGDDGILVEPDSPGALAHALATVLDHVPTHPPAGQHRVRRDFSTHAMVTGARAAYSMALARPV